VTRILCFAGSARRASLNKKLAAVAAEAVRAAGGAATLIDLADYPLPVYHGDLEAEHGVPSLARALAELIRAHAGLLIASPENNTSVSALLKNTLDWISRIKEVDVLQGRIAALFAASPGAFGGVRGLYHLRAILNSLGVEVLAQQFVLPRARAAFDPQGRLLDAKQLEQVQKVAARLVEVASRAGTQPQAPDADEHGFMRIRDTNPRSSSA
jgi:NAD(P)H-dependent FMN reductase